MLCDYTHFFKMHERTPKLGKAVSLATATGVIVGNSFAGSILSGYGATKIITGADIADKTVIKIANYRINSNNTLIDTILPKKDWRISLPDDIDVQGKYLLPSIMGRYQHCAIH